MAHLAAEGTLAVNAQKTESQFDPDLPTASAVIASLCCVATLYASRPSADLARQALDLARKLTAPEYAESKLIVEVGRQLVRQWDRVLVRQMSAIAMPGSQTIN